MKINIILIALFSFLLFACVQPKQPPGYDLNKADNSLAEASYSVSRSIVDLSETAQAAHPGINIPEGPSPASYGMGGMATIDWSGPVEPLVQQIAKASDYRTRVLGTRPAIPVIVTVNSKNVMLGDIVRDIGYQCGRRATVVVYPGSRVIELRYAKN